MCPCPDGKNAGEGAVQSTHTDAMRDRAVGQADLQQLPASDVALLTGGDYRRRGVSTVSHGGARVQFCELYRSFWTAPDEGSPPADLRSTAVTDN